MSLLKSLDNDSKLKRNQGNRVPVGFVQGRRSLMVAST